MRVDQAGQDGAAAQIDGARVSGRLIRRTGPLNLAVAVNQHGCPLRQLQRAMLRAPVRAGADRCDQLADAREQRAHPNRSASVSTSRRAASRLLLPDGSSCGASSTRSMPTMLLLRTVAASASSSWA